MSYRTTAGWSLIVSGVVTLALNYLPYDSLYWGIAFLVIGVVLFVSRQVF